MSKSNINNGETQAEVDIIDNNNKWKVSTLHFFFLNNVRVSLQIYI